MPSDHVADILYLGHKYNVQKCVELSTAKMINCLTNENVCSALSLAILFYRPQLIEACDDRIKRHTSEIFKSADFLECSKKALAHILRMDFLSCTEVDVFEASMAWIRAKENVLSMATLAKHLGENFLEIRFLSISFDQLQALKLKYPQIITPIEFYILDLKMLGGETKLCTKARYIYK